MLTIDVQSIRIQHLPSSSDQLSACLVQSMPILLAAYLILKKQCVNVGWPPVFGSFVSLCHGEVEATSVHP